MLLPQLTDLRTVCKGPPQKGKHPPLSVKMYELLKPDNKAGLQLRKEFRNTGSATKGLMLLLRVSKHASSAMKDPKIILLQMLGSQNRAVNM